MGARREVWTRSSFRSLGAPVGGRRRSQSGSVLLFVMAAVLVLSLAVATMLSMSLNSDIVANKLEQSVKDDHAADAALEDVVNQARNDRDVGVVAAACTDVAVADYVVVCGTDQDTADPDVRVVELSVEDGTSAVAARAKVKVIDNPSPGYAIEVCDWLLGRSVSEPLRGCSA